MNPYIDHTTLPQKGRSVLIFFIVAVACLWTLPAAAVGLVNMYHDALAHDPTYQLAKATWQSDQERLSLAHALVKPKILLTANAQRTYLGDVPKNNRYASPYGYGVRIEQPLFNTEAWTHIQKAKIDRERANAQYQDAGQALILSTAIAYFNVLRAYDLLHLTRLEQKAIGRQLAQTKDRYHNGLIAVTELHEAQAHYDAIQAKAINNANVLTNQMESLHEITGHYYPHINGFAQPMTTPMPNPNHINQWVNMAEQHNHALQAQRFTVQAAHKNIGIQTSSRWPTLDVHADINTTHGANPLTQGATDTQMATVGLWLNFPVYQGGLVGAKSRQAHFDYQAACNQAAYTHSTVISQTRQHFLGMVSDVSKIQADRQLIKSQQTALEGVTAGYRAGTHTIADVLDHQAKLYEAKSHYQETVYHYLVTSFQLKKLAGKLSPDDLLAIDRALTQPLSLNP